VKAFDVLVAFKDHHCVFWSIERPATPASNSELRRWFNNKAVIINGSACAMDDEFEEITSVVLFPNGKRKCTLW
jgi:hypothetical protein